MSDGVADLHLGGTLDARDYVAHISAADFIRRLHLQLEHTDLVSLIFLTGAEELHLVAFAYRAVLHLEICYHAPERVEHRVENQRLQRSVRVALGGGDSLDYGIQQRRHALSRPCRHFEYVVRIAAYQVADLVCHHFRPRRIHVNLVQHRDDFQIVVYGLVEIRNGLGLNALGRIHDQYRALAGSDGAGHLIRKIDMPRSVDEVQAVLLPLVFVHHLDRVALDGDALLLLQVHVVQHLIVHLPGRQGAGKFYEPVGKGALAVVDMCDYAEIPDMFHNLQIYEFSLNNPHCRAITPGPRPACGRISPD